MRIIMRPVIVIVITITTITITTINYNYPAYYNTVITFYSPSCLGQETAKGPFGLRVKLPPAYHTRRRLHTVPFNAERQAGKL